MNFRPYKFLILTLATSLVLCSCLQKKQKSADSQADDDNNVSSFVNSTVEKTADAIGQRSRNNSQQNTQKWIVTGGQRGQIIKRTAYTVSYNRNTRNPDWVSWTLTREHTKGPYKRDGLKFQEDMSVPAPRATNFDYMRSGYDRGHMCPSADNKWSQKTQQESFYYTNCCPQRQKLDAGDWNELEQKCRYWANKYGTLYIACGPIYVGNNHKRIGKNKVVVPEKFFKVVMTEGSRAEGPKALGFIYDNQSGRHPMEYYVVSVDKVEQITGFDFFSFLPDNVEQRIESQSRLSNW